MKSILSNMNLYKAFGTGLCFVVLSGLSMENLYAQEADDEAVVKVQRIAKPGKQFEMKAIQGVIKDDATGEPMGGIRVQALGLEQYSTLTEEDGSYKLDVPVFCQALYVFAEGYNPMQIAIKNNEASGRLIDSKFSAYYTDATSITSERSMKIEESSDISVEEEIEKRLAGDLHMINRSGLPGQGAYMTIRGISSINANAQPIIVLDGNIIDPQYERDALHEGFYNNLISNIDPENIESVKVLKNGTALYGAKGANGVIIINTKRGKSMATKIGVRIYGGAELQPKKLDMLNGEQYTSYLSDVISTKRYVTSSALSSFPFLDKSPSNYYRKVFSNNTDWQKDMYRNAMTQNYKINVEGGDNIGMYALSLGYAKSESATEGVDMDRLNLRFNTDIQVFSKLKTGLDISFNQNSYNLMDSGWSEDYSMQNIGSTNVLGLVQAPFISPYAYYYDETATDAMPGDRLRLSKEYAGKYAANGGNLMQNPFNFPRTVTYRDQINEALRNPYWILENGPGKDKNYAQTTQLGLNVSPKYQVTKTFSISDRFNYNMIRANEKYYLPVNGSTPYYLEDLGNIFSVLRTQFAKETTLQNDLRLEWGNTYGAHKVNVFGGWRYNNYSYSFNNISGYNNENDKLPILKRSMAYPSYTGSYDNWIDMTYYLDATYNYQNRYFAEFSLSSMASSRFGDNTKDGFQLGGVSWGLFPSLQLGWVLSNEKWFQTGKGVQYLKLTAGVEQSGNDDLDYYTSRTYWESQRVTDNTVGLYLKNLENSTIQWETTTKYNVALEGSFLRNRLQAGLDLYWHKTDNLLTQKKLSYISGMNALYMTNEGALTNKGFEVKVNAALINKKNWKWEAGLTMGHYNNKITELPSSNVIELSDVNGGHKQVINGYTNSIYGEDNVLTAVGHAVGSFYGWKTNGVFKDDQEASTAGALGYLKYPTGLADEENRYKNFNAGDVRFVDQNGDGVIDDADRVVIGNPHPDIYGNIFTSLTWKDLRLDVNFKYNLGNDIYNYQRSVLESGNTTYNQTTAMLRRWTTSGDVTDIPRVVYPDNDGWRNNERMSDRWIEDGSYLKLKNVRLTYTVPFRNDWLQGLKVWAEANNLFTITKYLGTDPEMSSRNSSLYQGIDTGLMPTCRNFNVGVSINL